MIRNVFPGKLGYFNLCFFCFARTALQERNLIRCIVGKTLFFRDTHITAHCEAINLGYGKEGVGKRLESLNP